MFIISQLLEKLTYRRLKQRADQITQLWRNPLYTVYPRQINIESGPPRRVVVLTPHADDETFGAGGAIHLHCLRSDDVRILLFSDNIASVVAGQMPEEEILLHREREFSGAMNALGVSKFSSLRLSDEDFTPESVKNTILRDYLIENQPDLLYLPSLFDNHQDHRTLNLWAVSALKQIPHHTILCRGYEVWSPLPATSALNISPVIGIKQQAMRCYASQLQNIRYDHHITGLNAYRAMTFGDTALYAEAFLETPADDYIALVESYLAS